MVARHSKKHRSTKVSESFNNFSGVTMREFCAQDLHTKFSNCFYTYDFATIKEVYG